MLLVSIFFRIALFAATGLFLASCRSAAPVPGFLAVAPYRSPLPVHQPDTVAAPAISAFSSPQRQHEAHPQPRPTTKLGSLPRPRKKPADQARSQFSTAAGSDTASHSTRLLVLRVAPQARAFNVWSIQTLVHYSLHLVFPAVLALVFFPAMWQTAYLLMLATMLMDLDHLLAHPIFDPLRCSVGYHPLHSFYALPVYVLLLLFPATQIVAVGLLFHLFTDTVDCLWNFRHCHECYLNSRMYALRKWVRKLLGREIAE